MGTTKSDSAFEILIFGQTDERAKITFQIKLIKEIQLQQKQYSMFLLQSQFKK